MKPETVIAAMLTLIPAAYVVFLYVRRTCDAYYDWRQARNNGELASRVYFYWCLLQDALAATVAVAAVYILLIILIFTF